MDWYYCKCNSPMHPHVCLLDGLLVGWSVGRSVIISLKGVELHFQAPIGARVYWQIIRKKDENIYRIYLN